MDNWEELIAKAEYYEINTILTAALNRYAELFPEWDASIIALHKHSDRNAQLDSVIQMLQNMKNREE